MEDEYYIPTIGEFKQGFEFEYYSNTTHQMAILDFSSDKIEKIGTPKEVGWVKEKIWWKHKPNKRIKFTDDNDIKWDISGALVNFFKLFDDKRIKVLIDEGRIRAKNN